MWDRVRRLLVDTVKGFFADECLGRAAAIAYFTLFSLPPVLAVAMAMAGLAFGEDAVTGAVGRELRGLLGREAAEAVEIAIGAARETGTGLLATAIGLGTLVLTASGTFGALQSALNAIWKTETPSAVTISNLLRAKAAAIGLVAATGFLLLTSLFASAAIATLGDWTREILPSTEIVLQAADAATSLALIALLFAAIYKVLPDRQMAWRDVGLGAVVTALLFTIGKLAISLYIGGTGVASAFGAAGSLAVVLVWIYYSAAIFLLGAEFTRAWAGQEGSHQAAPIPADPRDAATAATPPGGPDIGPPRRAVLPDPPPAPARPRSALGMAAAAFAAVLLLRWAVRPRA